MKTIPKNTNVDDFINYLVKMNYSQSTIESYFFSINNFLNYLISKKIDKYKFTEKNVSNYLKEIEKTKSGRTINLFLSSIESFFRYLKTIGIEKNFHLPKVKIKKTIKKNLFINNFENLLKNIEISKAKEIIKKRDKILIKILYYPQYSNFKTKNILLLTFENIFNDNKLNSELLVEVNDYFLKFKFKNDDFVFFSNASNKINTKKCLTEKAAQEIFSRIKGEKYNDLTLLNLRKSYYHKTIGHSVKRTIPNSIKTENSKNYLDYLSFFVLFI